MRVLLTNALGAAGLVVVLAGLVLLALVLWPVWLVLAGLLLVGVAWRLQS